MSHSDHFLSILLPSYNECENLKELIPDIIQVMESTSMSFEILVCDDGSQDGSLEFLESYHQRDSRVNYLSFSKNFGHQAAIVAGLREAQGDAVVMLDSDFQHPPSIIPELIKKWKEGYDIVNTERVYHHSTPWLKKVSSDYFYKILSYFSEVKIKPGFADFRLLDRKVVEKLNTFSDKEILIRATIAWIGFKQYSLHYECHERKYGVSKYTFQRSLRLAVKSLLHYTQWPLTLPLKLSAMFFFTSFVGAIWAATKQYYFNENPSWLWIASFGLFLTAWPLFCIGIVAIYLGRQLSHSSIRPSFIIRKSSLKSLDVHQKKNKDAA